MGVIGEMGERNEDEDEDEESDLMGIGPPFAGDADEDGGSCANASEDDDVIMGWFTKIEFFLWDAAYWGWGINLSWNMSMPFNWRSLTSEGRKSNPGGIE